MAIIKKLKAVNIEQNHLLGIQDIMPIWDCSPLV